MNLDRSKLLPVGISMIVAWAIGVGLGYVDELGLGPMSVAMFAVAVIAFFGLLRAGADMRTSITVAFVVLYFVLLSALSTSEKNRAQFDTVVGQELWDNFTYLIGVIVLFYFGASAAVEVTKLVKSDQSSNSPAPAVSPDTPDVAQDPGANPPTV